MKKRKTNPARPELAGGEEQWAIATRITEQLMPVLSKHFEHDPDNFDLRFQCLAALAMTTAASIAGIMGRDAHKVRPVAWDFFCRAFRATLPKWERRFEGLRSTPEWEKRFGKSAGPH
jgi:hypothetical protein